MCACFQSWPSRSCSVAAPIGRRLHFQVFVRKIPPSASFAAACSRGHARPATPVAMVTFPTWQTYRPGSRRFTGSRPAAGVPLLLKAARIHTAYLRRPPWPADTHCCFALCLHQTWVVNVDGCFSTAFYFRSPALVQRCSSAAAFYARTFSTILRLKPLRRSLLFLQLRLPLPKNSMLL